ncbi:WXG100 family type VII secretion target [Streptomyces sp. NPDC018019]|uniref:WXG100 family type VII secretion target n=1 Tax=Streptomyces sp. NPDC018019 TaxID=3365030 RepID=UPI00378C4623
MLSEAFDVDSDGIRRQGREFVAIGAEFGAASKRLQATLQGLGTPWCGAEFAETFAMIYEPVRDGMFKSMDSLGKRLEGMGEKLQEMARGYEAAERDGVQLVGQVSVTHSTPWGGA